MINTRKIVTGLLVSIYMLSGATLLSLQAHSTAFAAAGDACSATSSFLGLPTWYKYLKMQEDATGRCAPILSGADTEQQVNSALPIGLAILEGILRISGLVAVVMVFWAGFKFITSQGNADAAASAQKTAINAFIGLVIIIMATTLVSFVGNSLLS